MRQAGYWGELNKQFSADSETKIYIMEAVKSFNGELYSLNEYKPPISKAKMTQITKSAIKAIKVSM